MQLIAVFGSDISPRSHASVHDIIAKKGTQESAEAIAQERELKRKTSNRELRRAQKISESLSLRESSRKGAQGRAREGELKKELKRAFILRRRSGVL